MRVWECKDEDDRGGGSGSRYHLRDFVVKVHPSQQRLNTRLSSTTDGVSEGGSELHLHEDGDGNGGHSDPIIWKDMSGILVNRISEFCRRD